MPKKEKHKCLIPNCSGEGNNHLGIRLRRAPGPDNVWTHDTNAYLCDEHAENGLTFNISVALHSKGKRIYSAVFHDDGETFERETAINPDKSPSARSK